MPCADHWRAWHRASHGQKGPNARTEAPPTASEVLLLLLELAESCRRPAASAVALGSVPRLEMLRRPGERAPALFSERRSRNNAVQSLAMRARQARDGVAAEARTRRQSRPGLCLSPGGGACGEMTLCCCRWESG